MTPARRNVFALAERLGMLVSDLEQRMTVREFLGWVAYYTPPEEPAPSAEALLAAFGGAG